jgi:uncharacterized repeat protein (TIGR03803 family)
MQKLHIIAAAGLACGLAFAQPAAAVTYKVDYSFCTQTNCTDGHFPASTPVADANGNWYATTQVGGTYDKGTIFRVDATGKFTVLHSFCAKTNCTDGAYPLGGLIIGTDGSLYGMTTQGGAGNAGIVYKLMPNGSKWTFQLLYRFCNKTNCTDGKTPNYAALTYQGASSGVAYDGTSPLFGTTQYGGAHNLGTAFSVMPVSGVWREQVLYSFCSLTSCADGYEPRAGMTVDGSGNIFGFAANGGMNSDAGVVYELIPRGTRYREFVLYNFCKQAACADGKDPVTAPIVVGTTLYGTTAIGGAQNQGTVFKLALHGVNSILTTLHSFCSETNCTDGAQPFGDVGLTMSASGDLYGTTETGGDHGGGLIYMLGGSMHDQFAKVYSFDNTMFDGAGPRAGLALGSSGALYGTDALGGAHGGGTIYHLTP